MAENKKQHYIPQFYLKNFSEDQKQLWIYVLKSEQCQLSPIKSTCQGTYFYGKDPEYEAAFAESEQKHSKVIKKIIENESIESLKEKDLFDLYWFLLLQSARTKESKNVADNFVEFFAETYFKPYLKSQNEIKEYTPEEIDSIKIKMPEFYKYNIAISMYSTIGLLDLKTILLKNKPENPFISSDAPVVKNNYLKLKGYNLIGILSPGLQILCPLNSKLALLLYHQNAYEIKEEINSVIEIDNESDIDQLNKLQILNALDILFFSDKKNRKYVHDLCLKSLKGKKEKKIVQKVLKKEYKIKGEYSEIIQIDSEGFNYKIHFSFLKMNHKYNQEFKKHCKGFLRKNGYIAPFRNDELRKKMEDLYNIHSKQMMKMNDEMENDSKLESL